MTVDELSETIQRPLQECFPNGERRFEPALVQKLAQDASLRPTLLPLLQVTLQKLWKQGSLKLAAYTNLTDAIQERAEEVYLFSDHINVDPQAPRPARDQQELMGILLDLIHVAVDDTDRRDVRQPRTRRELEQSSAHRPRLIEELVNARLLSAASETRNGEDVEVIDIIHESLIDNWGRLRNAIEEQRQQLQRRARFKLWLGEWLRNGRQDGYLLLTDMQLAEARALVQQNNIELQNSDARSFYQISLEYQIAAQRVKDKAEAEHKVRQQWLYRVGITLVIMVIAAGIALWQWQHARVAATGEAQARATSDANAILAIEKRQQAQIAATGEAQARATSDANAILAATREDEAQAAQAEAERLSRFIYADQLAQTALVVDRRDHLPQRALLLGIAATQVMSPPVPSSLTTLYDLLSRTGGRTLGMHEVGVNSLAFSPDGQTLASSSAEDGIHLWSLTHPSDSAIILAEHSEDVSTSVAFSPDGKMLASGGFFGVYLWSLVQPTPDPVFLEYEPTGNIVTSVAFSPNGKMLASGSTDGTIRLWSLTQPTTAPVVLAGHEGSVEQVVFSPDGKTLASGSSDGTIRLWSLAHPDVEPMVLRGHEGSVLSVAFSPDGMMLASGSEDKTIRLWPPHQRRAPHFAWA